MTEIKQLSEEHYKEYLRISFEAYPGMGTLAPEDYPKWIERMKKGMRDTRRTIWGAFHDGNMVGVMRLHYFTMNVHGVKVGAGGLGGVAVDLTHKKEHIAKEMCEFYLSHYLEKGAPMAVLWPFRHNFYRKMGFGAGARIYQYSIKPASLPRGKSKKHVRFLSTDDIPSLNACYNRFYEQRTGMMEETKAAWENMFGFHKELKLVGYERDGIIEGFLIFRFERGNPKSFIDNFLVVDKMVYETPESLWEMLAFLHSQADQVSRVVLSTHDETFYFTLDEITNDTGNLIRPVYHESHVAGLGEMYRVLNCREMFSRLGDHSFGDVSLKLRLTINDNFVPQNAGSLVLHFTDGKVTVVDDGDYDIEINLDIAEFSSMFIGAVGFRSLHTYGLAGISDSAYIDQVDILFGCSEKPLCLTDF